MLPDTALRNNSHTSVCFVIPRLVSESITGTEISVYDGVIAQLGERLPCTQEVCGSIPHSSTILLLRTQENFRVNLKRCTAKFCSLKIWIKLKIETTHMLCVFESLKFSQFDDESKETSSGCEVKRLSVHGGCPGSQRR